MPQCEPQQPQWGISTLCEPNHWLKSFLPCVKGSGLGREIGCADDDPTPSWARSLTSVATLSAPLHCSQPFPAPAPTHLVLHVLILLLVLVDWHRSVQASVPALATATTVRKHLRTLLRQLTLVQCGMTWCTFQLGLGPKRHM